MFLVLALCFGHSGHIKDGDGDESEREVAQAIREKYGASIKKKLQELYERCEVAAAEEEDD